MPEKMSSLLERARAERDAGPMKDAEKTYSQLIREDPGNVDVRLEYSLVLLDLGRLDDARSITTTTAELATDPAKRSVALLRLGDIGRAMGDSHEAAQAYRQAELLALDVGEEGQGVVERARAGLADLVDEPPAEDRPPFELTATVAGVVAELEPAGDVTAAAVIRGIVKRRGEYAEGRAASLELADADDAVRKPVRQWLDEVRSLYEVDRVRRIRGRVVVLGLALLDPTIRAGLDRAGVFDGIQDELGEPMRELLTERGLELLDRRPTHLREEAVPAHTDNPATIDELGRKGFAKVLAQRIADVRAGESARTPTGKDGKSRGGSFLVHLHAPWGAGKTSLLNFIADELRQHEPRWVVIHFNAWRHQRIVPPWWWLMTTLYSEAVRELSDRRHYRRRRALILRLHEWLWRIRGGWPGIVTLLAGAAFFVVAWQTGLLSGLSRDEVLSWQTLKGFVVAAAAIVTPALTIFGLMNGVSRWVFATSARGARRFIDNTRDPMRVVQEHVCDLVHWIGQPVVVLVDDLDRCKGPYVVELLEGIQTLFREVPVTYVVAADRGWLSDSYAAEYDKFVSAADEPGRPLGYMFLEKTFQVSAGVPPSGAQAGELWSRLLRRSEPPSEDELDREREAAQAQLGGSIEAARESVVARIGSTPAQAQARLETLAVKMASTEGDHEAAHTLAPFRALLGPDPNPRAMKRLVNAYGIARGAETLRAHNLAGDHVREQETALWTLLCLRWPKLGEHLARHPKDVASIGSGQPPGRAPNDLHPLFSEPEVTAVVTGEAEGVVAHLDERTIRAVAGG